MTIEPNTSPGPETPRPLFVSYPKSGRTWLRYVLHLAGHEVEFTHAGSGTTSKSIGRCFRGVDHDLIDGRRVLFMHRNPIDTAVSFYFQVTRKDLPAGSLRWWRRWLPYKLSGRMPDRDINAFVLHEGYGVPKICAFNRAWLDTLATHPDAVTLEYEEARREPVVAFARLLAPSAPPLDELQRIAEESSFERMQQLEASGRFRHLMLSGERRGDPESRKVRRGRIQGYAEYLAPETIVRCREIAASHGFTA